MTPGRSPANFSLHMLEESFTGDGVTGDALLRALATLANPHRIRIVAMLAEERNYVSRLARDLGISRALLQVHLRRLEAAGLVSASVEVSADGKAMKFYEVAPFALHLTPDTIRIATQTLSTDRDLEAELRWSPGRQRKRQLSARPRWSRSGC